MNELAQSMLANYEKHGWELRRVLISSEDNRRQAAEGFPQAQIVNADIDALWFARPSHGDREAWELRLIAEQPYALFEAFEADESEEDREDARKEMENKMREYVRR
jgi:hypothetical protein